MLLVSFVVMAMGGEVVIHWEAVLAYVPRVRNLTNAQYLHKPLNNYSMLMAFVSGFSHSAVSRLKHTKALLQRSQLKVRILCARGDVMRGC